MKFLDQWIPLVSMGLIGNRIYSNILDQGEKAKIKPLQGVVIGLALFVTLKKTIDLAIVKFAANYKDSFQTAKWLVSHVCTIELIGIAGLLTPGLGVISEVAIIASGYFFSNINSEVKVQENKKNFNDISGMQSIKKILMEQVITPLKHPKKLLQYGGSLSKSILFYGPPGCGKTLFAEALAGELALPFFKVSAGDFASIYLSGTVQKINELFTAAIAKSPCVLFMDEFDGIASLRTSYSDSISRSLNAQITELLTQIDKALAKGVVLVAATNHIHSLDPSIVREGRFNTKILIDLPDKASRKAIFEHYLNKCPYKENIDYEKLAQISKNLKSSEIQTMVETVINKAFSYALEKIENNEFGTVSDVRVTMELFQECYPLYFKNLSYAKRGGEQADFLRKVS